jgi:trans-aconitate methyltransferase
VFIPTPQKTEEDLATEWDQLAPIRFRQLEEGADVSYTHVLKPLVFSFVDETDFSEIVDLGCGTGHLTLSLASKAKRVVGIDLSSQSISLARSLTPSVSNVSFFAGSIVSFAARLGGRRPFTLAVANMSLSAILDLESTLFAVSTMLQPKAQLVFTIPHPWFWPIRCGYHKCDWFQYSMEIAVEGEFRIAMERAGVNTTHLHRPLEMYVTLLKRTGFVLEQLVEPVPPIAVRNLYGSDWDFPRFLGARCSLRGS